MLHTQAPDPRVEGSHQIHCLHQMVSQVCTLTLVRGNGQPGEAVGSLQEPAVHHDLQRSQAGHQGLRFQQLW